MKNPCKDCIDRSFACHCTCAKYRQWAKIRKDEAERNYDARVAERYVHERGRRIKNWKVKRRMRGRT